MEAWPQHCGRMWWYDSLAVWFLGLSPLQPAVHPQPNKGCPRLQTSLKQSIYLYIWGVGGLYFVEVLKLRKHLHHCLLHSSKKSGSIWYPGFPWNQCLWLQWPLTPPSYLSGSRGQNTSLPHNTHTHKQWQTEPQWHPGNTGSTDGTRALAAMLALTTPLAEGVEGAKCLPPITASKQLNKKNQKFVLWHHLLADKRNQSNLSNF